MRAFETGCWCCERAGCRCWCWCCELAVHVVETGCRVPVLVLGAGAGCWVCTWWRQGAGCRCWVLAVRVVETVAGCARGGDRVRHAGCRELACRCSVLVPASDSEVITTAASDSEVPEVMGRMNSCTQHHTVLCLLALWGIYTLQVLFWPTAVSRAVLFARILLYV